MSLRPPKGMDGFDVLSYELLQEKAATLARLGRRAEAALRALAEHDAAPASDPTVRETLLDAAGEAVWYYVVQREVSGLGDGEAVLRHLGVSSEVRLRMGVRRKR